MSEPAVNPFVEAVQAIDAWQATEQEKQQAALVSIEEEEQSLLNQINAMRQRLESTKSAREQVRQNLDRLPEAVYRRQNLVLMDQLPPALSQVQARAVAMSELAAAAQAAASAHLEDPEVRAALEELENFKAIEATLETLPPTYRDAVLAHHDQVKAKLAPVLANAEVGAIEFEGDPLSVAIVGSADVNDGEVTACALIIPVRNSVADGWSASNGEKVAPEGAEALLGFRIAESVSQLLIKLQAENAPVMYRGFLGCLMIQIWLAEHHVTQDVSAELDALIATETGRCAGLKAAKLSARTVWVPPFAIAPPEEGALPDLTDERPHVQAMDQ